LDAQNITNLLICFPFFPAYLTYASKCPHLKRLYFLFCCYVECPCFCSIE
jgi:hypothetical protein